MTTTHSLTGQTSDMSGGEILHCLLHVSKEHPDPWVKRGVLSGGISRLFTRIQMSRFRKHWILRG